MNRVLRSFPLALVLILIPIGPLARAHQQSTDTAEAAKVKAEVAKRGTGDKSRVTIKLRNGSELKGSITQTGDNMFTLKDEKTSSQRDIGYAEVAKVKGRGLSRGAKFGLFAAIAGAAVVIAAIISVKNFDPFEHGILR
jgi:small nuclear ribonucleoprotein (snRNP)-like protein